MPATILSDNGASSGTAGLKTSGSNDGQLALQTTTSGGAATTALTIDTSQNATFVGSVTSTTHIPTGSSAPTNGLYLPAANTPAISSNSTKVLSVIKGSSLALEGATPQTGTGISFPATQSASTDVNTLDDYEEGTFTPAIVGSTSAGTGTYSVQVGNYTKIGNTVSVRIFLVWSAHTGTGNMSISGLPFTSNSNSWSACACRLVNLALSANNIFQAVVSISTTTITLEQIPTGGGGNADIPMDTSAQIMLFTQYIV